MARPRIIKTPDELYKYWMDYKKQVPDLVEYNIVSFTNYLRGELKNFKINSEYFYQLNPEFSKTKKNIDDEIEQRAVELLATDFHGGRVFYLKNKMGWSDKQEIKQTNKNIEINIEEV